MFPGSVAGAWARRWVLGSPWGSVTSRKLDEWRSEGSDMCGQHQLEHPLSVRSPMTRGENQQSIHH